MSKRALTVLCLTLLFAAIPAVADQWDKKTTMTFSAPVEIPGVVLPAGTYVFRLAESNSNRHIVQVFNEEQDHIYAPILAIPNYRLKPTGETIVQFEERAANTPPAVKAWFYPADNFGQEFVYPKARAVELAQAAHEPVLAADVTPVETPQQLEETPVVAETPEKEEIELAQVVQPKPVETPVLAPEPAPPARIQQLPETASPLPLLSLVGLSSLGLAGVLRAISKHIS